ncbi:hypothetical protein [Nocardiopsis sp. CC223A]|uniref:hypothetical protein n=1 Tax=Nocardiopsis sp. CC223A TaxID=3044051 RepID=UPI00278C812E|nr:hypothetical protein [Nocardiopsis sp. CC223A]
MPFVGIAAALLLSFGVADALTRLHYTTASATATGTVLEIDRGRPVVAFTTADGTEVTTTARGDHLRDDPREVTVRYLTDRPTEAMLDGSLWIPPILFMVPLIPVVVWLVLRHPHGPRAVLYRARVRARELGRPPEGTLNLAVTLWLVCGFVVTACGLALITGALASIDSWSDFDLFVALGLIGAALLPTGLDMLVHGLGRYLERAPGATEPVQPKLFGSGTYLGLYGVFFVGAPLVLLVLVSMETDVDTPEKGTATVLAVGCGDMIGNGRYCDDKVALEYEVDGLRYTQTTDDVGFDLTPGDEARVAWDADDPSLVRVEGVR